jgi:LacI family transcriptional regulator
VRALAPDAIVAAVGDAGAARASLALGRPIVNVSHFPGAGMTRVGNDDDRIGVLGARHLLRCGFHCLAFLGQPGLHLVDRRREGFVRTVREAGRTSILYPSAAGNSRARLGAFLRGLPRPAAVMASDDLLALHVTELCGEIGRRVPDDLAVLGVNNDDVLCGLARPELSSVALAVERIGLEAAACVDAILSGREEVGRVIELPPAGVVVRRSTDVLAVTDEIVAAAVRFIRAHAGEPLSIDRVLGQVPVSRSSLQRRFRQALGHGPNLETRLAHVEVAKRLLMESRLPLKAIAQASGLVRPQQLSAVFRELVGMTPGEFRRHVRTCRPPTWEEGDATE